MNTPARERSLQCLPRWLCTAFLHAITGRRSPPSADKYRAALPLPLHAKRFSSRFEVSLLPALRAVSLLANYWWSHVIRHGRAPIHASPLLCDVLYFCFIDFTDFPGQRRLPLAWGLMMEDILLLLRWRPPLSSEKWARAALLSRVMQLSGSSILFRLSIAPSRRQLSRISRAGVGTMRCFSLPDTSAARRLLEIHGIISLSDGRS